MKLCNGEMTGLKPMGSSKTGGSEILWWLEMTGLKTMGFFKNERRVVKFYYGWKWQGRTQTNGIIKK